MFLLSCAVSYDAIAMMIDSVDCGVHPGGANACLSQWEGTALPHTVSVVVMIGSVSKSCLRCDRPSTLLMQLM